jgi:hypothetical protein
MPSEPAIADIAHVIQLAVAPVFLLTGIGAMLALILALLLFLREVHLASAGLIFGQRKGKGPLAGAPVANPGPQALGGT